MTARDFPDEVDTTDDITADDCHATALAEVTFELSVSGPWGPDCPLGQVYRQARIDAETQVRKALTGTIRIKNISIRTVITDATRD